MTVVNKLLLSAYACHPTEGSEPGVGWNFLQGALSNANEVWLLTRRNNVDVVAASLGADERKRVHVIGHDLGRIALGAKSWLPASTQGYYALWQTSAIPLVRRLHDEIGFDLAHHVTFASDWLPCALAEVPGLRFVWGPVGGASEAPPNSWRYLGARGTVAAISRGWIGGLGRQRWGMRAATRSVLTVGLNPDEHAAFVTQAEVRVEPNCLIKDPSVEMAGDRDPALIVCAGRLLPWKGWALAVDALAHLPDHRLLLAGQGPDLGRLKRRAKRRGVSGRFEVLGEVDRLELMRLLRRAGALLHPSLHDSSPWVVAEAVSSGTPVVGFDLGGVGEIIRRSGLKPIDFDPHHAAQDLANAVKDAISNRPRIRTKTWTDERIHPMLAELYSLAVTGTGTGTGTGTESGATPTRGRV